MTVLLVLACILACKLKTKSKKISYLAESLRIEILMMIGYGDRSQTQALKSLIAEVHPKMPPINRSTISKIETQYRELAPRQRPLKIEEETRLNMLKIE